MPALSSHTYTVGWICALTVELTAARAFLDETHPQPQSRAQHDDNTYVLGSIAGHNVVMAALPAGEYGTSSAASVAKDMLRSFPDVRFGLMVGIGGGAPSKEGDVRLGDGAPSKGGDVLLGDGAPNKGGDVRLGDVVVSRPGPGHGGVVQYDFGKRIQGRDFQHTGFLSPPPRLLLTATSLLESDHEMESNGLKADADAVFVKYPKLKKKYSRPGGDSDRLYKPQVTHPIDDEPCGQVCAEGLVKRPIRDEDVDISLVHYGLIASGNSLMKNAEERDEYARAKGVLCFEMEAAGLMNTGFKCLVIRGICDYSDTHKNKDWQGYASLVAAGYAAELLRRIPPSEVQLEEKMDVEGILQGIGHKVNQTLQATLSTNAALQYNRIKRWLSPPDPSTNVNLARTRRSPGTGSWFVRSQVFQEWLSGSRRHLWLVGSMGCGKTVLSATVLDHLQQIYGNHLILRFFFDFSDAAKRTLDGMLRSFVFQFYGSGPDSTAQLDELFKSHGNKEPTTEALREAIRKLLGRQKKVLIVLDALDEATSRDELLNWIKEITSTADLSHVQLICLSRPEAGLRDIVSWIGECNHFQLDKVSIDEDIRSYITDKLENDTKFKKWAAYPMVLKDIRETISRKSDGMFRWAACLLDTLQACLDREDIETALRSLPGDLEATYARILENIPSGRKRKAIRLLQFLVYSKRPLTVAGAIDVLAVRLDDRGMGSFDRRDRMPDPREITEFCPSLVSAGSGGVCLAHLSVQEFLLSGKVEGFLGSEASLQITRTCLVYLFSILAIQERSSWRAPLHSHFALAGPAAGICLDNFRYVEDDEPTMKRVLSLLRDGSSFRTWRELYESVEYTLKPDEKNVTPCLYFVCSKGLIETTKRLLEMEQWDVNAPGGEYNTALGAASAEGHTEIVRLLLGKGANANAGDGSRTPLYWASSRGHADAAMLLLENGADVNRGSPLYFASENGLGEVVRLLLEKGASIEDTEDGDPLCAASGEGHKEVVRQLLEKGADINRGRPLLAASTSGHVEVVQLLLEKGADINRGRPLLAASISGHIEVVQLLLEKGASIEDGSPLCAASGRGHIKVVQLLLANGASIEGCNSERRPLCSALRFGHDEVVRLLLGKGAGVDGGNARHSPLWIASRFGRIDMVRLLLEKGAAINDTPLSALRTAVRNGHSDIVCLLLNKGAKIDETPLPALIAAMQNNHQDIVSSLVSKGATVDETPLPVLIVAIQNGHTDIVRLLLDKRANMDSVRPQLDTVSCNGSDFPRCKCKACDRRGYGTTALHTAVELGRKESAPLRLEAGASVNRPSGQGQLPLYIASSHGYTTIVQLLLKHRADVNALGGPHGTALCGAAAEGHAEIVQLLLDNGADISGRSRSSTATLARERRSREIDLMLASRFKFNSTPLTPKPGDRAYLDMPEGVDGHAAFHAASREGDTAAVRELLDKGADICEGHMLFALWAAHSRHNIETAELLSDRLQDGFGGGGADVKACGCELCEPLALEIAMRRGHTEIAQLLRQRGAKDRQKRRASPTLAGESEKEA